MKNLIISIDVIITTINEIIQVSLHYQIKEVRLLVAQEGTMQIVQVECLLRILIKQRIEVDRLSQST